GLAEQSVEVSYALRHLKAAGAFEAVKINHDHVAHILKAAVSQHLRALADEPGRLDVFDANLFTLPRERQRPQLEKSEGGRLVRTLRQADGELDFHRTSHRVLADSHELIEDSRQREKPVLEDGS